MSRPHMRLVFIYGPPAVGKYTVGKILVHRTGFKFFHNHVTVEVVKAEFPEQLPIRTRLLKRIRLIILSEAARMGQNTIFTLAYSGRVDDRFVASIVRAVERYGGQVDFVQLLALEPVLMHRVTSQQRARMKKIHTLHHLQEYLSKGAHSESMKFDRNLVLDTSQVSPHEAAEQIIRNFRLPEASENRW